MLELPRDRVRMFTSTCWMSQGFRGCKREWPSGSRLSAWLVHPAFVVGIFAFGFVGVDVAAVLVEVDFAILLAHVDLELARGAAALPAVVAVADSEVTLAEAEGHAAAWSEFDVEKAPG